MKNDENAIRWGHGGDAYSGFQELAALSNQGTFVAQRLAHPTMALGMASGERSWFAPILSGVTDFGKEFGYSPALQNGAGAWYFEHDLQTASILANGDGHVFSRHGRHVSSPDQFDGTVLRLEQSDPSYGTNLELVSTQGQQASIVLGDVNNLDGFIIQYGASDSTFMMRHQDDPVLSYSSNSWDIHQKGIVNVRSLVANVGEGGAQIRWARSSNDRNLTQAFVPAGDVSTTNAQYNFGIGANAHSMKLSKYDGEQTVSLQTWNTDGSVSLYHKGVEALKTTFDGVIIRDPDTPDGGNTKAPVLRFENQDGTGTAGFIQSYHSGPFVLRNQNLGAPMLFQGIDTEGTVRTLLQADPEDGIALNYKDETKLVTTNAGVRISLPSGTIAGTDIGQAGLLIGNIDLGLGFDTNEIVSAGSDLYLGALEGATHIRSGNADIVSIGTEAIRFKRRIIIEHNEIARGSLTDRLVLSGNSNSNAGASIQLFGESHTTQANDILFRAGTNIRLLWDDSAGHWSFQNTWINGVADLTRGIGTDNLYLSGGTNTGLGANIILYGQEHPTNADDVLFRSGSSFVAQYDASASAWDFKQKPLRAAEYITRGVNDEVFSLSGGSETDFGANVYLYGPSHTTQANDIIFRTGTSPVLHWQNASEVWDFRDTRINNLSELIFSTGVIANNSVDSILIVSGSNSGDTGANIALYGSEHPIKANDIEFRQGTAVRLHYDYSQSVFDFRGNKIRNMGRIERSTNTDILQISGGTDVFNGANMLLYGGAHSSQANDFRFRAGTNDKLSYSDAVATWNFQANSLAGVADIRLEGETSRIHFSEISTGDGFSIVHDGTGFADTNLLEIRGGAGASELHNTHISIARDSGSVTFNGRIYAEGGLRLPSLGDLSLSSSDHAFQIGDTSSFNLAMDANEIMARNNGANSKLLIQNNGGTTQFGGLVSYGFATKLTIASGIVTFTKSFHVIDTEADSASDDLDTIHGGSDGDILILQISSNSRAVTVKDNTGNIRLSSDFTMDVTSDKLVLIHVGSNWHELSRSNNA